MGHWSQAGSYPGEQDAASNRVTGRRKAAKLEVYRLVEINGRCHLPDHGVVFSAPNRRLDSEVDFELLVLIGHNPRNSNSPWTYTLLKPLRIRES